jgi:hypothetical protein
MKKHILIVNSLLITTGLLFTACSSKKEVKKEEFSCKQDGIIAPKWTCNVYVKDKVAAVGIAKMNAGNDKSFQRAEALADARDALSARISSKVSNLFKSYKGTTGSGADSTYDKTSSKVSKQLASQTLNGSRAINSWKHPKTNELYLLVVVDNSSVKSSMKESIKSSFKNEKALYQRFLESQASKELDFELSK